MDKYAKHTRDTHFGEFPHHRFGWPKLWPTRSQVLANMSVNRSPLYALLPGSMSGPQVQFVGAETELWGGMCSFGVPACSRVITPRTDAQDAECSWPQKIEHTQEGFRLIHCPFSSVRPPKDTQLPKPKLSPTIKNRIQFTIAIVIHPSKKIKRIVNLHYIILF